MFDQYVYVGATDTETRKRLERIARRFTRLSPDAQEVLAEDVEKFANGADEHGPLDIARGDFLQHIIEESTDLRYYARMEILRRRREARTHCTPTSHVAGETIGQLHYCQCKALATKDSTQVGYDRTHSENVSCAGVYE